MSKLDDCLGAMDALRADAAKAHQRLDAISRRQSGQAPKGLMELQAKHDKELDPLLHQRDKLGWNTPAYREFQNSHVQPMMARHQAEREAWKSEYTKNKNG